MHRKNLKKVAEEVIQLEIKALKNLKKNNIKKDYIDGDFKDIEDDNDRKV
jgi:hypothetical protein